MTLNYSIILFLLCVSKIYCQYCSGVFESGGGTIASPPDPGDASLYQNNADCEWIIGVQGLLVDIAVDENFGIEFGGSCEWDWLQIEENGVIYNSKYCADGGALPGSSFTLEGPVRVTFVSDGSANDIGFSLDFDVQPPV